MAAPQKIVTFIDIGHSKTTATVAEFCYQNGGPSARVLCQESDKNLGGRDLDWQVLLFLANEFQEQHQTENNPKDAKKSRLRMLDSIEEARKALSGDDEAFLDIDQLLEGNDYEKHLLRDDFDKIVEPQTSQLKNLLKKTVERLREEFNVGVDQIDTIELLGESTRVPVFQSTIVEAFNQPDLKRTMNSIEFCVRGATILQVKAKSENIQCSPPLITLSSYDIERDSQILQSQIEQEK